MKRSRGVGKVEVDHEAAGEEIYEDEEGGGVSASEKKRRLSGEQVRALERSFEEENKLEPERKARLAEELGLRPRQVAVWFQNRRARWKTKQLEKDYDDLKSRYEALRVSMDLLRADHVALLAQVEDLRANLEEDEAPLPGKEEEEEDPLFVSTESSENHSGQSQLGSSPAAPLPPPVAGGDGETFSYYDGTPPPFCDRHVSCSPTPPPPALVRVVEEHEFLITRDSPPSSLSWYYYDHWG